MTGSTSTANPIRQFTLTRVTKSCFALDNDVGRRHGIVTHNKAIVFEKRTLYEIMLRKDGPVIKVSSMRVECNNNELFIDFTLADNGRLSVWWPLEWVDGWFKSKYILPLSKAQSLRVLKSLETNDNVSGPTDIQGNNRGDASCSGPTGPAEVKDDECETTPRNDANLEEIHMFQLQCVKRRDDDEDETIRVFVNGVWSIATVYFNSTEPHSRVVLKDQYVVIQNGHAIENAVAMTFHLPTANKFDVFIERQDHSVMWLRWTLPIGSSNWNNVICRFDDASLHVIPHPKHSDKDNTTPVAPQPEPCTCGDTAIQLLLSQQLGLIQSQVLKLIGNGKRKRAKKWQKFLLETSALLEDIKQHQ